MMKKGQRRPTYSKDQKKRLADDYAAGHTYKKVASYHGVAVGTVVRAVKTFRPDVLRANRSEKKVDDVLSRLSNDRRKTVEKWLLEADSEPVPEVKIVTGATKGETVFNTRAANPGKTWKEISVALGYPTAGHASGLAWQWAARRNKVLP